MESVVEDVEDQRQTEGSPANFKHCKKLVGFGWDDFKHSTIFSIRIRYQLDEDIDSNAVNKAINN